MNALKRSGLMSKIKEYLMKGMSAVMLDCEKATLYATQNEMKQLGCVKKIQLKMHIASCELCRTFVKQSQIITRQINVLKEIDDDNLKEHLTNQQKEKLQETVESYLNNK